VSEEHETVRAEGSILVSFQGGQVYWCEPDHEGHWRCGRCETGTLASAEPPSRCNVCQAEVVLHARSGRSGFGWLIVLVLLALAALAGWFFLDQLT
jgi:hypothetical protein